MTSLFLHLLAVDDGAVEQGRLGLDNEAIPWILEELRKPRRNRGRRGEDGVRVRGWGGDTTCGTES